MWGCGCVVVVVAFSGSSQGSCIGRRGIVDSGATWGDFFESLWCS